MNISAKRHSRNEIENGNKPQAPLPGLRAHLPCESVPNMRTAFRGDDSTQDRASDLFSSGIHFLLQIPSIQTATAEMKLKTELSPKLFY